MYKQSSDKAKTRKQIDQFKNFFVARLKVYKVIIVVSTSTAIEEDGLDELKESGIVDAKLVHTYTYYGLDHGWQYTLNEGAK